VLTEVQKLRELAAWYREFADRAGNAAIWDLRLRMAEDLEAKADQQGRQDMTSVDDLRAEARRLLDTVGGMSAPQLKKELAIRAFELSQRAEAIERSAENPEILKMNIARYNAMLGGEMSDENQRKTIEAFLSDAEELLDKIAKKTP
jgi:hypothetical protein